MPRKTPRYKELGLTKTKNGYLDKSGKYIPERQYRKMVGTPIKGSQGYKERKAAKERGEDFRATPAALKTWAKKTRGGTAKWFQTGVQPDVGPEIYNNKEKHFKAIAENRREVIDFKFKTGAITEKQRDKLMEEFREEHFYRDKMAKLYEQLANNSNRPGGKMFTNAQRARIEREYQAARRKYDKAREKMDLYGIIPHDSHLDEGYYH